MEAGYSDYVLAHFRAAAKLKNLSEAIYFVRIESRPKTFC
jgi:hypothetical protein